MVIFFPVNTFIKSRGCIVDVFREDCGCGRIDEDVGCNGNAQRGPQPIMTLKEREVIKFLRLVETGEGMSVAQATDILQWGRSFNDERAQCLPKTLLTCWRIVDKVMFKDSVLEQPLLV